MIDFGIENKISMKKCSVHLNGLEFVWFEIRCIVRFIDKRIAEYEIFKKMMNIDIFTIFAYFIGMQKCSPKMKGQFLKLFNICKIFEAGDGCMGQLAIRRLSK